MSKIATDLDQSKKLAKILPIESADMYWDYDVKKKEYYLMAMDEQFDDLCVLAWSLSALMDILPNKVEYECKTYFFKLQTDVYSSGEKYYYLGYQGCCYWLKYEDSKDLLDACVNMIVKLKEKNLL